MTPVIVPVFKNVQKNLALNILSPTEIKMLDLLSWCPDFKGIIYCAAEKKLYRVCFSNTVTYRVSTIEAASADTDTLRYLAPLTLVSQLEQNNTIIFFDLIYPIEKLYSDQGLYSYYVRLMQTPFPVSSFYFQSERIFSYVAGMNADKSSFFSRCIIDEPAWIPKLDHEMLFALKQNKLSLSSQYTPFTIVWGGALYDWYDPFSLIETVCRLYREGYSVRLIFPILNRFDHSQAHLNNRLLDEIKRLDPEGSIIRIRSQTWLNADEYHTLIRQAHLGVTTLKSAEAEDFFAIRNRYRSFLGTLTPYLTNGHDIAREALRDTSFFYDSEDDALYIAIKRYLDHPDIWKEHIEKLYHFAAQYRATPDFVPKLHAPRLEHNSTDGGENLQLMFAKIADIPSRLSEYDSLIIWGAGTAASIIIPMIQEKVAFIVDNDPKKWESTIASIPIRPLDTLQSFASNPILVTILFRKQTLYDSIPIDVHPRLVFLEDILQ
ncbi:hypothetical protein [Sulfuricurvum sp.]|uniref:hypothetical protein n=1 Tax=Sulfuricurvum sp. TaxID=2025608 RepID=UPI0026026062|nr:hypothetical protein [Sulfuricurvum sp.]MDD3596902.1 hypothetical protein [Sulfuricurvum sp.]